MVQKYKIPRLACAGHRLEKPFNQSCLWELEPQRFHTFLRGEVELSNQAEGGGYETSRNKCSSALAGKNSVKSISYFKQKNSSETCGVW